MRIFQVVAYPNEFGGLETYTTDLFRELERRGHRNLVLAAGAPPVKVDSPQRPIHRWPRFQDVFRTPTDLLLDARQFLSKASPDVAFVHGSIDARLAAVIRTHCPVAYFAHTYSALCPSGGRFFKSNGQICQLSGVPDGRCLFHAYRHQCNTRRPSRLLRSFRQTITARTWLRELSAIVCDSRYVAEIHAANGFRRDRLHVVPSPVAIPQLPSHPMARRKDILFVGRLVPHKGLHYLIRALPKVRSFNQLVVAGGGPELSRLQALVAETGLKERVTFRGRVDHRSLGDLYASVSLVVVPSVWPEPLGMVGPEAMAYGTPVVAFRVGGIHEWLDDGRTGYLVEPRDVDGLAEAIDRVLEHPGEAASLGLAGRAFVEERFSVTRHVDDLLEIFTDVIHQGAVSKTPVVLSPN